MTDSILFRSPPRLLLGVAFLFWGGMHDRPLPALIAAILMEGRYWTNLRWPISEKGFARAWQLSVLALIVATVGLLQIEEREASDFLTLLSWLPFMMLPLALAQQYCAERAVPMTTFSFIARRKLAADRRAGRLVKISYVHIGYPYFLLILIVSGMGVGKGVILNPGETELRYTIGMAVLAGWGIFQFAGKRERPAAWGVAYLTSILIAVLLSWGLISAYRYFVKSLTRPSEQARSSFETQTSMGQVIKLQQSPEIVWRYYHESGPTPDLLRISVFNEAEADLWRAPIRSRDFKERIPENREVGGDYEAMLRDGEHAFVYHEGDKERENYQTVGTVEGMVTDQALIPHPVYAKRFEQVPTEIFSVNSMGSLQLNGPSQSAMEIKFFSDSQSTPIELDPSHRDLVVPDREQSGVDRFLGEMKLVPGGKDPYLVMRGREAIRRALDQSGLQKRRRIRNEAFLRKPPDVSEERFREIEGEIAERFHTEFQYTLFLKGANLSRPFSQFLNDTKEGHCEFFAGSTAMLLRRMNIPCRYVVGFVVREEGDEGEWLLRGKHAHAWVQAYVGGKWINEAESDDDPVWRCRGGKWVNVDLTPPDWLSASEGRTWYQGLLDGVQKFRTNFSLWLAKPTVSVGLKITLVILGSALLAYVLFKMITTRGRKGRAAAGSWEEQVRSQGLLRGFERWMARRVGPRPSSMPMGSWLRSHLQGEGKGLAEVYEALTFNPAGAGRVSLKDEIQRAKVSFLKQQKNPGPLKGSGV